MRDFWAGVLVVGEGGSFGGLFKNSAKTQRCKAQNEPKKPKPQNYASRTPKPSARQKPASGLNFWST